MEEIQGFIRRNVADTQELAELVSADSRFRVVAPHDLNLLCVQYRDSASTDALIDAINASGTANVTRTVLDGEVVMRVSVGARATTRQHVQQFWQQVQQLTKARSGLLMDCVGNLNQT